jgi:hypothetical protein
MIDEIDELSMIKGFVREYKNLYPFAPDIDENKIKPDLEYYGFWGRTDKEIYDQIVYLTRNSKPFICRSLL